MEALPCSKSSHPYANFLSRTKIIESQPASVIPIPRTTTKRRQNKCRTSFEAISAPVDSRKPSSKLSLLEKAFDMLDKAIIKFLDPPLDLSVDPSYVLSSNFAPVDEMRPTKCEVVHGSIPWCLNGVYIRNGPNPQFVPNGPHHYLDGDGMVHAVTISQGRATFCSRYVKTNKYLIEHQVRSCVVPNIIGGMQGLGPFAARLALFAARAVSGQYDIGKGIGVANTNLSFFGGRLYAICESDLPYAIKIKDDGDVITTGRHDFDGELSTNMTAHPKIDPETKEAFAFRYWATPPYLTYFRFDANGNKQPDVPIFAMKHPSLTHDLAITEKYVIICDIQLGADPMNPIRGRGVVSFNPKKVPKIGVLPRYTKDESELKWFEAPGFNIFHAVNAWDETDEDGNEMVVLVAPNISPVEHFLDRVDLIKASMEKVTIHMGSGVVSRDTMSGDNLEFPVINPSYVGKKNRYVYAAICEETPMKSRMMRTRGVAKLDIAEDNNGGHDHTVGRRMYGKDCYGGEAFFIAREAENSKAEEDDGYVVSYVHNESSGESRLVVMDAQSPTLEVVAVVKLPQRVPYGLHGIFVREKDLNQMRDFPICVRERS